MPPVHSSLVIRDDIAYVAQVIQTYQKSQLANSSGNLCVNSANDLSQLDAVAHESSGFSTAWRLLQTAQEYLSGTPPREAEARQFVTSAWEKTHYSAAKHSIDELYAKNLMNAPTWLALRSVLKQYKENYREQCAPSSASSAAIEAACIEDLPAPSFFEAIDKSQIFLEEAPRRLDEIKNHNDNLLRGKKISQFQHLQICNFLARAHKYADKPLQACLFESLVSQAGQLFEASQFVVDAPAASVRHSGFDGLNFHQTVQPIHDNKKPAYYQLVSLDEKPDHQIQDNFANPYTMSRIAAAMGALPDPLGRHDRVISINSNLYGLDFIPIQDRHSSFHTEQTPTYLMRLTGPNPLGEIVLFNAMRDMLIHFRLSTILSDQQRLSDNNICITDTPEALRLDNVLARAVPYDPEIFRLDASGSWQLQDFSNWIDLNALRPDPTIPFMNYDASPADNLNQARQIVRGAYHAVAREYSYSSFIDRSELKSLVNQIAALIEAAAHQLGDSNHNRISLKRAALLSVLPAALAVESYAIAFKNQNQTLKQLAQALPRNDYARAALLTLGHVTFTPAAESNPQTNLLSRVSQWVTNVTESFSNALLPA